MAYGIIYKVTNSINGKVYIGQTTMTLRNRWRLHCHVNSTCSTLKKAIEKHGKDAFNVELVDSADNRKELNEKEKAWIQKEKSIAPNGYNVDEGGYYIEYSEESRRRMSEHHADVKGKNNPMYGAKHSIESCRLISEKLSGKYTGKNSFNHRAVINLDTNEMFDTATDAAKAYGVTVSTLTKTCRGVQKQTAGCRWAFIEEEVVPNDDRKREME